MSVVPAAILAGLGTLLTKQALGLLADTYIVQPMERERQAKQQQSYIDFYRQLQQATAAAYGGQQTPALQDFGVTQEIPQLQAGAMQVPTPTEAGIGTQVPPTAQMRELPGLPEQGAMELPSEGLPPPIPGQQLPAPTGVPAPTGTQVAQAPTQPSGPMSDADRYFGSAPMAAPEEAGSDWVDIQRTLPQPMQPVSGPRITQLSVAPGNRRYPGQISASFDYGAAGDPVAKTYEQQVLQTFIPIIQKKQMLGLYSSDEELLADYAKVQALIDGKKNDGLKYHAAYGPKGTAYEKTLIAWGTDENGTAVPFTDIHGQFIRVPEKAGTNVSVSAHLHPTPTGMMEQQTAGSAVLHGVSTISQIYESLKADPNFNLESYFGPVQGRAVGWLIENTNAIQEPRVRALHASINQLVKDMTLAGGGKQLTPFERELILSVLPILAIHPQQFETRLQTLQTATAWIQEVRAAILKGNRYDVPISPEFYTKTLLLPSHVANRLSGLAMASNGNAHRLITTPPANMDQLNATTPSSLLEAMPPDMIDEAQRRAQDLYEGL